MDEAEMAGYKPGEPAWRRVTAALFLAGMGTFALLYTMQAILPALRADFQVTPGEATLAVSTATFGLGFALLVVGPGSDLLRRKPLMVASLLISSLIGFACAFAPNWTTLLVFRALQGVALAGLPAVATAYLREEIHPSAISRAIGLYVGGTAIGGMLGRLLSGALAEAFGWRSAAATIGVVCFGIAIATRVLLPPSRAFVPAEAEPRQVFASVRNALGDPVLWSLYAVSGMLMGGFVAVYNALGFRLAAPPYQLPLTLASLVFLSYAPGSFASTSAGALSDRVGYRKVLPAMVALCLIGLGITWFTPLWAVVLGLVILTAGFFGAHGVASGWVAVRAARLGSGSAQAASFYLFAYYLGSSVFGSTAGVAWTAGEWPGVVGLAGGLWLLAGVLALLAAGLSRKTEA